MSMLLSLWLPVIVSAVVVFFASFLAWMVLPHHKSDWKKFSDEDGVMKTIRDLNIDPGQYVFPCAETSEQMKSDDFKKRMQEGPNGTLTLWPGPCNMGLNMFWTFVCFLVVSVFVAYLAGIAMTDGAPFVKVFRFTGTAAIMAYCFAGIPNAIWFKRKLRNDLLDGIAYGLLTGVVFGLLWPS